MNLKALTCSLLTAVGLLAQPAHAHESGRVGVSVRGLVTPSGAGAALVGWEGLILRSQALYLGVAGYGGHAFTAPDANMGYGGLIVGFKRPLIGDTGIDLRLLTGGGGGVLGHVASGNMVLEPSLTLDTPLDGEGSALGLTAGYLYMPSVPDFSGAIVGLRISFKGRRHED